MLAGVIALQGDYWTHAAALQEIGLETREIRRCEDAGFANPAMPREERIQQMKNANLGKIQAPDALVIPGGESSTMDLLGRRYGIDHLLGAYAASGKTIFGTCAGAIWLGKGTHHKVTPLGLIDVTIERNAYGRQIDSFITDIEIDGLSTPFEAVFIRAPKIVEVGPDVEVLSVYKGDPILVRQNNIWLATFHPERSKDRRLHQLVFGVV